MPIFVLIRVGTPGDPHIPLLVLRFSLSRNHLRKHGGLRAEGHVSLPAIGGEATRNILLQEKELPKNKIVLSPFQVPVVIFPDSIASELSKKQGVRGLRTILNCH